MEEKIFQLLKIGIDNIEEYVNGDRKILDDAVKLLTSCDFTFSTIGDNIIDSYVNTLGSALSLLLKRDEEFIIDAINWYCLECDFGKRPLEHTINKEMVPINTIDKLYLVIAE